MNQQFLDLLKQMIKTPAIEVLWEDSFILDNYHNFVDILLSHVQEAYRKENPEILEKLLDIKTFCKMVPMNSPDNEEIIKAIRNHSIVWISNCRYSNEWDLKIPKHHCVIGSVGAQSRGYSDIVFNEKGFFIDFNKECFHFEICNQEVIYKHSTKDRWITLKVKEIPLKLRY